MAQAAPSRTKINTNPTQAASGQASRRPASQGNARRPARGQAHVAGDARRSTRDPGRAVIEVDGGITVYPPEEAGAPWRATFTENGRRRFRQGATEAELAARLEKVTERLQAGAANMERPGAELIAHYLDPDRRPRRPARLDIAAPARLKLPHSPRRRDNHHEHQAGAEYRHARSQDFRVLTRRRGNGRLRAGQHGV
jgi:hypothetical protein